MQTPHGKADDGIKPVTSELWGGRANQSITQPPGDSEIISVITLTINDVADIQFSKFPSFFFLQTYLFTFFDGRLTCVKTVHSNCQTKLASCDTSCFISDLILQIKAYCKISHVQLLRFVSPHWPWTPRSSSSFFRTANMERTERHSPRSFL